MCLNFDRYLACRIDGVCVSICSMGLAITRGVVILALGSGGPKKNYKNQCAGSVDEVFSEV